MLIDDEEDVAVPTEDEPELDDADPTGMGPGLPGDEDPPTPEPKPTAKDKEPKGDDKAGKEDADRKQWDRDRQRRDQDAANLRKETESLKAQLAEQREIMASLVKGGKPKADDDEPDPIDALTPDSPMEDSLEAIKAVHKSNRELARQLKEQSEANAALQAKLAERETQEAAKAQEAEVEAYLNDTYDSLSDKYGRKFQTQAIAAAKKELADEGYSEDEPPVVGVWKKTLEYHWRLASDADKKGSTARPKPPAPTLDGGTGGRTAAARKTGRLADVAAEMRREGRL